MFSDASLARTTLCAGHSKTFWRPTRRDGFYDRSEPVESKTVTRGAPQGYGVRLHDHQFLSAHSDERQLKIKSLAVASALQPGAS